MDNQKNDIFYLNKIRSDLKFVISTQAGKKSKNRNRTKYLLIQ